MTHNDSLFIARSDQRIDKWVHHEWPQIPYSAIQKALRIGDIRVNQKKISSNYRLNQSDTIYVYPGWLQKMNIFQFSEDKLCDHWREKVSNWIIYTHKDFWIIRKPAGISCQKGTNQILSIDDLMSRWAGHPVHLVHRLDKPVSGALIIAKTPHAASILGNMMKEGAIQKRYWALVHGKVKNVQGHIQAPLIQCTFGVKVCHEKTPKSLACHTEYFRRKVYRSPFEYTWLELCPRTGRKHQLRVHLSHIKHPIIGDKIYDPLCEKDTSINLKLHCCNLSFFYEERPILIECEAGEDFFTNL
ncbi:RluA family pseudouridine synthase [Holospora obtusa]|nr:RluA family pseudouridine synthase [Holospora obtusa]